MGLFFVLSFSAAIFLLSIQRGQCALIVEGKESIPHSRPYLAVLLRGTRFFCGGNLINENWVLTAAQCSHNPENEGLHVVLGAHERNNVRERGRQNIKIANTFIFPEYKQDTSEHDIMLLKLEKKAKMDQYVKPIQLPSTFDDVQPGTSCVVAGWGRTNNEMESNDTLHEITVTVIDRSICNKDYYGPSVVKRNMLCAGDKSGGKGVCQGDAGAPLICGEKLRGIVSFGSVDGSPDVYTRLTEKHISWIKKTIKDHS